MSRPLRRWVAGIVAVGLVLAGVVALVIGASARDAAILIATAAVGALVASLAGALVLRRLRQRSVRAQAVAIATSALLATVVGVLLAANAMFISSHDLGALLVVIVVSAAVAIGAALQLGEHLDLGARQVRDLARRLGEGQPLDPEAVDAPLELTELAQELADVPRSLAELRRKEDALDASRRELVAWVSHDLRSPLSTIRAMAEALDDGVVDDGDTMARYHHQIRRDAERLTTLVDDLFELSRINSGSLRLHTERVSLAEVVADALDGARTHAEVKGVELHTQVGPLPAVDVAPQELTRVIHNLLDNAIRHTPAGRRVVVRSAATDGTVELSVVDQCGGIPDTDLTRVFDVAFRGDAARSRDDRGGGLGLAIAKGLVEAQSGSIDLANQDDGCRFTVRLPLST